MKRGIVYNILRYLDKAAFCAIQTAIIVALIVISINLIGAAY